MSHIFKMVFVLLYLGAMMLQVGCVSRTPIVFYPSPSPTIIVNGSLNWPPTFISPTPWVSWHVRVPVSKFDSKQINGCVLFSLTNGTKGCIFKDIDGNLIAGFSDVSLKRILLSHKDYTTLMPVMKKVDKIELGVLNRLIRLDAVSCVFINPSNDRIEFYGFRDLSSATKLLFSTAPELIDASSTIVVVTFRKPSKNDAKSWPVIEDVRIEKK